MCEIEKLISKMNPSYRIYLMLYFQRKLCTIRTCLTPPWVKISTVNTLYATSWDTQHHLTENYHPYLGTESDHRTQALDHNMEQVRLKHQGRISFIKGVFSSSNLFISPITIYPPPFQVSYIKITVSYFAAKAAARTS